MARVFRHTVVLCVAALYFVAATATAAFLTGLVNDAPVHQVVGKSQNQCGNVSGALLVQVAKIPVSKQVSLPPGILVAAGSAAGVPVVLQQYARESSILFSPVDLSPKSSRAPPAHLI
ncbi:MAG: hypothetical protein KF749_05065 [Bacteroidetes bacterium]|nr:hypothetical protein [Bacteroidota bacterium]MCW5896493.1 hypothetical protein [Bacteroidota bacterium]